MATQTAELTALQLLPWAKVFLDYTDDVIAALPEDNESLDWRPTEGGWHFSIREQAMHIVDVRHDVISWVSGGEPPARFAREYGGTETPWQFESAGKPQIMDSLRASRAAIDALLARPQSALLESTDNLRARHDKAVAQLREAGKEAEAAEREARGPSRLVNLLLFLNAHEQSHRGVLQSMLRLRGHAVPRYA